MCVKGESYAREAAFVSDMKRTYPEGGIQGSSLAPQPRISGVKADSLNEPKMTTKR